MLISDQDVRTANLIGAYNQGLSESLHQAADLLKKFDDPEYRSNVARSFSLLSSSVEKLTREELEKLLQSQAIAAGVAAAILWAENNPPDAKT